MISTELVIGANEMIVNELLLEMIFVRTSFLGSKISLLFLHLRMNDDQLLMEGWLVLIKINFLVDIY